MKSRGFDEFEERGKEERGKEAIGKEERGNRQ